MEGTLDCTLTAHAQRLSGGCSGGPLVRVHAALLPESELGQLALSGVALEVDEECVACGAVADDVVVDPLKTLRKVPLRRRGLLQLVSLWPRSLCMPQQ